MPEVLTDADMGYTPPDQNAQGVMTDADMGYTPEPDTSGAGAFASRVAEGAVPAAAGGVGMAIGGALGALGGPAAPFTVPAGAIAGGLLAGGLTEWLQNQALEKTGVRAGDSILGDKYRQAAEEQHPLWSGAGALADDAVAFAMNPAGAAVKTGARVLSGAVNAGIAGVTDEVSQGKINPADVAGAAIGGYAFPGTRQWVNKVAAPIVGPLERAALRRTSRANPPAAEPATQEPSDIEVDNPPTPAAPPVVSTLGTSVAQPKVEAPGEVGFNNSEAADANDPTRDYRKNATPAGPAAVTRGVVDPTVAAAMGGEPPTPPIDTGIPQAASPRQQQQQVDPAVEASRFQREALDKIKQKMSSQQLGEAFNPEFAPSGGDQPAQPQGAAPPAKPISDMSAQEVHEYALNRPIIRSAMPSIANSVKGGPVVIDPRVPEEYAKPLALHETVEEWFEAQGKSYDTAHELATHAEKHLVEQMGMDWKQYSADIQDRGKDIEAQKIPYDQMPQNLHVDPYDAIGHHTDKEKLLAQSQVGGPEVQPPAAPGDVTAPVTPDMSGLETLKQKFPKVFERLNKGEDPERRIQEFASMAPDQQSAVAEKIGKGFRTLEGRRDVNTLGRQAKGPEDAAQQNAAVEAVRKAVAANQNPNPKLIPTATDDRRAFQQRIKDLVQAVEAAPASQYTRGKAATPWLLNMTEKIPEVQIYKKAKALTKVLRKKDLTNKQITDFISLETQLSSGPGAAAAAKETQATGRINADMELSRRPQAEDVAAATAQNPDRFSPEPMKLQPGKDNSYADGVNKAKQFLDALTEPEYRSLEEGEFNPRLEFDEPNDGKDLIKEMMRILGPERSTAVARRIQGEMFDTGAEDMPGQPQSVRTAAEVKALEGPKTDLTDPQIDRLRRAVSGTDGMEGPKAPVRALLKRGLIEDIPPPSGEGVHTFRLTPAGKAIYDKLTSNSPEPQEDELAKLIKEQNADHAQTDAHSIAAEGTNEGVLKRMAPFFKDESGAIKIPAGLQSLFASKAKQPQAVTEAADQLRHEFNLNEGAIRNTESRLRAVLAAALPRIDKQGAIDLNRKLETRTPLNAKEQEYYDRFVKPLKAMDDRLYNLWRENHPEAPVPYDAGRTAYMRRLLLPETKPINDLPWKHTLGDYNPSAEERDFMALDNGSDRLTFKMTDGGDLNIIRNGASTIVKNLPASFDGTPGQSITLKIKGKSSTFKVEHATTPEITKDVPGLQYVEHPVITHANAIYNTQKALIRDSLLRRMQKNDTIKTFSTTDPTVRKANGYKPTILDEMAEDAHGKTRYYHPALAWLMDDFARPGIANDTMDAIGRAANILARPLYAISPGFHPLNVAANWAVGTPALVARANSLGKVGAWAKGFLPDLYDSFKGVLSQNDRDLNEFRAAGGRLMYDSQLFNQGLIEDAVNQFGMKLARRPGMWNSAAKAVGIPDVAADLPRAMMQSSTRLTWMANDMLSMSLYKTAKRVGLSPIEAAQAVSNYIGAYRATTSQTFLGSRILKNIANEPALSWFGPYHQDLWGMLSHIAKGAVAPVDAAHRREAFAATAALTGLTYGVFPYLIDPFVQSLTGNENTTSGRRGAAALADIPRLYAEGDPQWWRQAANNVLTPSIPLKGTMEGLANQDFKGKSIVTPGAPVQMQAGEAADYAARTLVPPYGNVASLAKQQGVTVGDILRKMAESSVGIREPTDKAARYKERQGRYNNQEINRRTKNPEGFIESLTNGR